MLNSYIDTLLNYAIKTNLIEKEEEIYFRNQVLNYIGETDYEPGEIIEGISLEKILEFFIDNAVEKGVINDTANERDLYDTGLMAIFVERPANVRKNFFELYKNDKKKATDYFYELSKNANYIRTERVARDIRYKCDTEYGTLDITINLSKPEKDPRDIERLKKMAPSGYPKCQLCLENEGYAGRLNHPARGNLRTIPMTLGNEKFYMQYSPYVYYNEHCIVFNETHKPMVIDKLTFRKLLDFLDVMPHYFIGSNADLPIVGGSILSHEHFQGGNYEFAMVKAPSIYDFKVTGYNDVECSIVKWPLSVIRLRGENKEAILSLADHILINWIIYSNPAINIYAYTDEQRHNTITPIARMRDGKYELDLVLRNNVRTEEYPFGVFHPHEEFHNIKKENIGLIEVMGLAVLPSRLKDEMAVLKKAILNHENILDNEKIAKHYDWITEIMSRTTLTADNIDAVIDEEIGQTFKKILECAGVFKMDEQGIQCFKDFCNAL